jgi:acyl-ACP thioesterase
VADPPRVFERAVRPGFADCGPSGRVRLDALARWLQDVAYADVEDAGLAGAAVWVLRRTRIAVERWPRFGEEFRLRTFCTGMGRMWAERTTTISPGVEAVALWVHLDPDSWRPMPLSPRELELYGPSAAGRKVTARLHHPPPPPDADGTQWLFRATELDIADHINNAAYWQPLEQELLAGSEPAKIEAEIEFRSPAQPGEKLVVSAGQMRWILCPAGEVHASILITNRE